MFHWFHLPAIIWESINLNITSSKEMSNWQSYRITIEEDDSQEGNRNAENSAYQSTVNSAIRALLSGLKGTQN